ncbi:hypothetical protein HDV06_002369 [Boothiomyces sp. JEL0866]|nr:hypothetical protein HDV06_002369 [Boothiomyces sp. JEL0866]
MAEFNGGVNVLLNQNQPKVNVKKDKEATKKPVVKDLPPTRATMIPCLSGMRGVAALSVVYLHLNSFSHGQMYMATVVPRFQGDPLDTQPYYANFKSAEGLPPQSIYEYFFLINVQSIFWSIPPEIEYYFVIPFIITTFEAAHYADSVIFISKKEREDMEAGIDTLADLPFMERIFKKLFRNLLYSVFRILHLIFWSYFALPGVLDTYYWYEGQYNRNHLPPHYFRFWSGSFTAIILYWLEQNYLVPQPLTKKEEDSTERRQILISWSKKIFFFLCDKVLWLIIFIIISQTNWYQGNYFGKAIPNDPAWPALDWAVNTTYTHFINGYDLQFFDQAFTSTRLCAYTCGFIIFLICYGARNGSFSTFFTWDFFMYAGDVSFPVYLCHFIGIRESMRMWVDYISETRLIQLDQNIMALWLTLVIATLMHELIEKPCMKIGNFCIRYLRSTVFKPKPQEDEELDTVAVETVSAPLPTFSDRVEPESLESLIAKRKSANLTGQPNTAPTPVRAAARNSYLELEGFNNQRSSLIKEIFGDDE